MATPARRFKYKLEKGDGPAVSFIRMPFDVKSVFGKARVPVKLTINDYAYRTTICHMGDLWGVPLRREHRENAKVEFGDIVDVLVEADLDPRVVDVPLTLKKFLQSQSVWDLFGKLSYTHKKEFVRWIADAKKEETRDARKRKMIGMLKKKEHL